MINKNYSLIFILIIICILTVGAVSANDAADNLTVGDDTYDDVDTNDVLSIPNDENILGDNPGSFQDLQTIIDGNETGSIITLDKNYTYDNDLDGNEIIISKDLTIDGKGFTINANNASRIFTISCSNVVLKNINFINGNDKSIVYFDNVDNAEIENCKFINNYASNGTVYFTGNDLTIIDSEFINSTTAHKIIETFDGNNFEIDNFNGTSLLYVNSTGDITISKSSFLNSKFSDFGINIIKSVNVTFDDVEFKNNVAFKPVYDYDDVAEKPFIKTIYEGTYENFYEDFRGAHYWEYNIPSYVLFNSTLIYINNSLVNIGNSRFNNNTVKTELNISYSNITVNNVNFTNSSVKMLCEILYSNIEMNNIDVSNISDAFYKYVWNSTLNKFIFAVKTGTGQIFSASSLFVISSLDNVGNSNCDPESWNPFNTSITNINIHDIHANYNNLFLVYSYYLSLLNFTVNNIEAISEYSIDWNGTDYIKKETHGSGMIMFEIGGVILDVEDINITNSKSMAYLWFANSVNYGNSTFNNIFLSNMRMTESYYGLLSIADGVENVNVTVNSYYLNNLSSASYYTYNSDGETYSEYRLEEGISALMVSGTGLNLNISDVDVNNCLISESLLNLYTLKTVNMHNVTVHDSFALNLRNSLIYVDASEDVLLENISADNIKVVPMMVMEEYMGETEFIYISKSFASSGFKITSENGDVYLNNINLTNIESYNYETDFIDISTSKNIALENINIKNISGIVGYEYNGEYTNWTGDFNNGITISSGETINITNLTIDALSTGIGYFDWNDEFHYFDHFLRIEGSDANINNVVINNSAIGGIKDLNTISVLAFNNLNVNNFVVNNITSATDFNYTRYNSTLEKYVSEKVILPSGYAGIMMQSGAQANISNVNIANTCGGGNSGSLFVSSTDLTMENISIENITPKCEMTVEYNSTLDKYIEGYNYATMGATGVTISVEGNANLNNISMANFEVISGELTEQYLLNIGISGNLTVNQVDIKNIKEKETVNKVYVPAIGVYHYTNTTGSYSPAINLNAGYDINLTNVNVDKVYSAGIMSFLEMDGNNVTIENISIINSKIMGDEEASITIDSENIYLNNFTMDNITGLVGKNNTYSHDVYDDNGIYQNTVSRFSYNEGSSESGFGIAISANHTANVCGVDITNSLSGGSSIPLLDVNALNITIDRVLFENITSFFYYSLEFNENVQKYIYKEQQNISTTAINVYRGNVSLSNIKLNNISAANEGFIYIYATNVDVDNFTISNIYIPLEMESTYYDEELDQYITPYIYYDVEEFIEFFADNGMNISSLAVDNIPCIYDSFLIYGKNVIISNSSFKNLISGKYPSYMQYDENIKDYVIVDYSNDAWALDVGGTDISILGTIFENITLAGYALNVDGKNIVIGNDTFKDINALKHFTINWGENETRDSYGSAINADGESVLINNSHFINCSADYGGALYLTVPVNITNSEFIECSADYGGAIYIDNYTINNTISNTNFTKNAARYNGGAIYIFEPVEDGVNVINGSIFVGNHANHDGGAFYYNNTIDSYFFDDYQWFNRTAMFSDGLLSYSNIISDSLFENNTDYAVSIIAKDIAVGSNQTVVINISVDGTGEVTVNITDENGTFINDLDGNEIKNRNYTLTNGNITIPLGKLPIGQYNVSAYYNNYDSNYHQYSDYGYHYNSTTFNVHDHFLNVTVNETVFVGENVTIIAKLNNLTTGTVNITVSDGETTLSFNNIPVVNGTVNYILLDLGVGNYSVNVTYNGDEIFYPISNATVSFEVIKRNSTLKINVNDTVYDNDVKIIVEVPEMQKGNVTLTINGNETTKEVTDGKVEFVISNLDAQKWNIAVTFLENEVYNSYTNYTSFEVIKANLTANATTSNITIGDNATFNLQVPDDFKGNVSITVDNINYNDPVKDVIELSGVTLGDKTATVIFYGDDNYNDKTIELEFTVSKVECVVSVDVENVTYPEVPVAVVNVSGKANGTVEINVGDETFAGEVKNGQAVVNLTGLKPGDYAAEIIFHSSDDYNTNADSTVNFTISKVDTSINVTNDGNKVIVTLPENATGNVTITIGNETYTVPIVDGTATLEDKLTPGNNSVKVNYGGDKFYNDASKNSTLTLDKYDSSVEVSVNDIRYGDDLTVKVSVPKNQTGNVTIKIGDIKLTSEIKAGVATFNVSDLDVGDYKVEVAYSGDDNYKANTNSTTVVVKKADLAADATAKDITEDDNATFNITVPDDFNGKVKITVDNITYDGDVKDVVELGKLTAGNKTAVVTFYGDKNYENKTINVDFTVSSVEPAENTTMNISIVNVTYDDAVAVIDVGNNANGTVNVTIGNKTVTADVVDGKAVIHLDNLIPGDYDVTAEFVGEDGSKATANATLSIPKEDLAMDVKVTVDGDNAIVEVTLPDDATGVVELDVDGVKYSANVTNGKATIEIPNNMPGNHTVPVTYSGDDKYNNASTTADYTVKPIGTVIVADRTFTRVAVDYYANERGGIFYGTLMDTDGNVLPNKTVYVAVNGPIYNVTTDDQGRIPLQINLMNANIYTYALFFQGDEEYNASHVASSKLTVIKKNTTIKASNKKFKVKAKTKTVSVTLKTTKNQFDGKTYLKTGKKVSLKVNGKTYTAKINKNGVAKFKVKLTKKGKFVAKITFKGDRTYNACSKKITLTVK